jgi:hypothetical protein
MTDRFVGNEEDAPQRVDAPTAPNRKVLEAAKCWFSADVVAGQRVVTDFKRSARYHQSCWREKGKHPVGAHRRDGKDYVAGSLMELKYARDTKVNFLSDPIREAVEARLRKTQPYQTLNSARLWSDLLSSMPMCFNLFGELHASPDRLAKALATLWPKFAGTPRVEFEWSPGRCSRRFLNDRTAFDAAIILTGPSGLKSAIGIETKYHEDSRREAKPKDDRLKHYRRVVDDAGIFKRDWERILGTDLQQIWRDHLLLHSMLRHRDEWVSGVYVLVHPSRNPSYREAADRYRGVLKDDSTFQVRTIEELLDAEVLLPDRVETAFRERYFWGPAFDERLR